MACGIIFCFINFGTFFAEITKIITTSFFSDEYAWRISFLLGGVASIASYFLRKEISETAAFLNKKTKYDLPILALLKNESLATIRSIATISIFSIVVGFFSVYLPTYLQLNNISNSSTIILINLFVFSLISIPAGSFADKFGPFKILLTGSIGLIIFGLAFYYSVLVHSKYILPIMLVNNIFMGLVVGVACNYASTLFPSPVRASGLGFSYNFSFALNGALLALSSFCIAEGFVFGPLVLIFSVVFICLLVLFFTKNIQQNISI